MRIQRVRTGSLKDGVDLYCKQINLIKRNKFGRSLQQDGSAISGTSIIPG